VYRFVYKVFIPSHVRTVEERCGIDAMSRDHPGEIPHLVDWNTLSQAHDDIYDRKGSYKVDGGFAEKFECLHDS
jgi:hypothetical protein